MKEKKKVLSLILALMLTFALCVPTFAANPGATAAAGETEYNESVFEDGVELEVDVIIGDQAIQAFIPTSAQLIINPFGLEYEYKDFSGDDQTADDAIIFPVQYIRNFSKVGLKVTAKAAISVDKSVTIASSPNGTVSGTNKAIGLALVHKETTDVTVDDGDVGASGTAITATAIRNATDIKLSDGTGYAEMSGSDIVVHGKPYIAFDIIGGVAGTWTENDEVGLTLAFTLQPVKPVTT